MFVHSTSPVCLPSHVCLFPRSCLFPQSHFAQTWFAHLTSFTQNWPLDYMQCVCVCVCVCAVQACVCVCVCVCVCAVQACVCMCVCVCVCTCMRVLSEHVCVCVCVCVLCERVWVYVCMCTCMREHVCVCVCVVWCGVGWCGVWCGGGVCVCVWCARNITFYLYNVCVHACVRACVRVCGVQRKQYSDYLPNNYFWGLNYTCHWSCIAHGVLTLVSETALHKWPLLLLLLLLLCTRSIATPITYYSQVPRWTASEPLLMPALCVTFSPLWRRFYLCEWCVRPFACSAQDQ